MGRRHCWKEHVPTKKGRNEQAQHHLNVLLWAGRYRTATTAVVGPAVTIGVEADLAELERRPPADGGKTEVDEGL